MRSSVGLLSLEQGTRGALDLFYFNHYESPAVRQFYRFLLGCLGFTSLILPVTLSLWLGVPWLHP